MVTKPDNTMERVEEKNLTVRVSHSPYSGNFFIDFLEGDKYLMSQKLNTEAQAEAVSRELGIKIMIQ